MFFHLRKKNSQNKRTTLEDVRRCERTAQVCRWIDRAKSPSRRSCPVQHNSLKRSFPLNARRNTKSRIATHGFPHPIHNIRLPSRLRGQYVCSKSPATLCSAKFASTHPTSFLFLPLGKMLVVLRDGRKLHGVLRSYDQFGTHRSFAKHHAH